MAKLDRHTAELVLHDRQGTLFVVHDGKGKRRLRIGHLEVRDGSLIWYPWKKSRGWRMTWDDLDRSAQPIWRPRKRAFDARKYQRRSRP